MVTETEKLEGSETRVNEWQVPEFFRAFAKKYRLRIHRDVYGDPGLASRVIFSLATGITLNSDPESICFRFRYLCLSLKKKRVLGPDNGHLELLSKWWKRGWIQARRR